MALGSQSNLPVTVHDLTIRCSAPTSDSTEALDRWWNTVVDIGRHSRMDRSPGVCFVSFQLRSRSHKQRALEEVSSIWWPLMTSAKDAGLVCGGLVSSPSLTTTTQRSWVQAALHTELLWTRTSFEALGGDQHGDWGWIDHFELCDPGFGRVELVASTFAGLAYAAGVPTSVNLVGRRAEIARLDGLIQRASQGVGAYPHPLLVAPAGMGKSTLVTETLARANNLGLQCIRTHCVDYPTLRRQAPLPRILTSMFGAEPGPTYDSHLSAAVAEASAAIERPDAIPILRNLLDLPLSEDERSTLSRFSPQHLHVARSEVIALCLLHAARRKPTVLVFEDLHWASEAVLECLAELVRVTQGTPFVLIATSRPPDPSAEQHPLLREAFTPIDLRPLSSYDARSLATQLARDQRKPWQVPSEEFLSDRELERCVLQAGGNPLYLTQYLQHATGGGESTKKNISLESLLLRRLEELKPQPRALLEVAASIGFYFDDALALDISRAPDRAMTRLEEAGLVTRWESGHRFIHALIRDAIRSSLSEDRRSTIHLKLASATTDPLLRAEHWASALDPRAYDSFIEVARQHRERFRWFQALAALDRAATVAIDNSQLAHTWTAKGEIHEEQGEGKRSLRCFETALRAMKDAGLSEGAPAVQRASLGVLSAQRLLGLLDEAESTIETLLRQFNDPHVRESLPVESARLDYLRGSIAFSRGKLDLCWPRHAAALATLEGITSQEDTGEAEHRSDRWPGHRVYAQALSGMGDALYAQGRYSEAAETMQRCIDTARERRFGRIEVSTLHMLGIARTYTGDWRAGASLARTCWEQACQVGDARATLLSELNIALPHFWGADSEGSLKTCRSSVERAEWIGSAVLMGMTRSFTAHIRIEAGDRSAASRDVELALEHLQTGGERLYGGVCYGAALSLACQDDSVTRDERVDEWLTRGERLLSSAVVSHNYLYFTLGAAPAAFIRRDIPVLSSLLHSIRTFFRSELRACPHGVASSLAAWVALHLESLGESTGESVPTLWAKVQEQPLLAGRVQPLGEQP